MAITIDIRSDLAVIGQNEDGEVLGEVFYAIAQDDKGYCWRGPTVGVNLRPEAVEAELTVIEMAVEMGGEDIGRWEPTFPSYGSEAYVESEQEAACLYAEKNDMDYFPV